MNVNRLMLGVLCGLFLIGCGGEPPTKGNLSPVAASDPLVTADVEQLLTQSVEAARALGESVTVAVVDREGNVLGDYAMPGSPAGVDEAVKKARTAAYLSSDQHGFTTLTACFIVQGHYPPGVSNVPGGPLFGVGESSLPGGNVMPNGSGLTGAPGGVPLFRSGDLVGGLGVAGGSDAGMPIVPCAGAAGDEVVALTGSRGFHVPPEERGDRIFVDGIQLLYQNGNPLDIPFQLDFSDLTGGTVVQSPRNALPPRFPLEGEVDLGLVGFDFSVGAQSCPAPSLSNAEVRDILDNAVARAGHTRAAIRRPLGSPARVFVTVCDVDGCILGIVRTPDATLFSFDVSAQKARTAVAFSDPNAAAPEALSLARMLRDSLGVPQDAPLAMTTRALGFLSQNFFPPGIDEADLGRGVVEGPFFGLQSSLGLNPYGNGITIFPGGIPLYRNGVLVGAIGVSGDGVDQDDYIAGGGAVGYEPPAAIRCDQFFYRDVRLPYVKFPRQPDL